MRAEVKVLSMSSKMKPIDLNLSEDSAAGIEQIFPKIPEQKKRLRLQHSNRTDRMYLSHPSMVRKSSAMRSRKISKTFKNN
jgi:hypothetical protein